MLGLVLIDDDESGSTGFHSALPLEVHGTGYVQMQMISNSKAEKLVSPMTEGSHWP